MGKLIDAAEQYCGWIPTVGGGLSFDVFGKGHHPRRPSFANKSDEDCRIILCSQTRFLADTPLLLRRLVTKLFGMDGNFTLVCVGMCPNNSRDRQAHLKGKLYIFKNNVWNSSLGLNKLFDAKRNKLNTYDRRKHGSLKTAFNDDYHLIVSALANSSDFNVDFILKRSGSAILTIPTNRVTRADAPNMTSEVANKPTVFERIVTAISVIIERIRVRFRKREEFEIKDDYQKQETDLVLEVCQQLFFFLKDITHNHQHHDPYTDTMSLLYEVKNEGDEYFWRSDTLRNLYRMVLGYKRSQREEVFASSQGILAYLDSFHRISVNELKESNNSEYVRLGELFPKLNNDLMGQSISASQTVVRNDIQEKIRISEKFQSVLVSIIGLMFALIGLLQLNKVQEKLNYDNISQPLVWFGNQMISQPFIVTSATATIVFVFYFTANLKKVLQIPILRKLFRSIYVIGVSATSIVFVVLAVFAIIITVTFYTRIDRWEKKVLSKPRLVNVEKVTCLSAHISKPVYDGRPSISSRQNYLH